MRADPVPARGCTCFRRAQPAFHCLQNKSRRFQNDSRCVRSASRGWQQASRCFQQDLRCFQQGSRCFQQDSRCFQQDSRCFQQDSRCFQQGSRCFQQDSRCFQQDSRCRRSNPCCTRRGACCFPRVLRRRKKSGEVAHLAHTDSLYAASFPRRLCLCAFASAAEFFEKTRAYTVKSGYQPAVRVNAKQAGRKPCLFVTRMLFSYRRRQLR